MSGGVSGLTYRGGKVLQSLEKGEGKREADEKQGPGVGGGSFLPYQAVMGFGSANRRGGRYTNQDRKTNKHR